MKIFLQNQIFSFSGRLSKSHEEIGANIEKVGGKVLSKICADVSYLVCSEDAFILKFEKVQEAERIGINVVREEFLFACFKARSLLNIHCAANRKYVLYVPTPRVQIAKIMKEMQGKKDLRKLWKKKKQSTGQKTVSTKKQIVKKSFSIPSKIRATLCTSSTHISFDEEPLATTNGSALVWCDKNVRSFENIGYYPILKSKFPHIELFSTGDELISYTRNNPTNKIKLLCSGAIGLEVAATLQGCKNLESTVVFTRDPLGHLQWARNYQNTSVCSSINQALHYLTISPQDIANYTRYSPNVTANAKEIAGKSQNIVFQTPNSMRQTVLVWCDQNVRSHENIGYFPVLTSKFQQVEILTATKELLRYAKDHPLASIKVLCSGAVGLELASLGTKFQNIERVVVYTRDLYDHLEKVCQTIHHNAFVSKSFVTSLSLLLMPAGGRLYLGGTFGQPNDLALAK